MRKTVAITVCFCMWDVALAAPVPLSGPAISEMIGGAVVELDTPLGTRLPITYGDDGRMTGQAGALGFYLGATRDRGKWWVASDQLCQKWERWFDAETQCMRIRKDGPRIHWVSRDGKSGTGTVHLRVAAAPETVRAAAKTVLAPPAAPKASPAVAPLASARPPRSVIAALPSPAKPADKLADKPHEVVAQNGPKTEAQNATQNATQNAAQDAAQSIEAAPRLTPQFSRLTVPFFMPLEVAALSNAPGPAEEAPTLEPPAAAASTTVPAPAAQVIAAPAPPLATVAKRIAETKPVPVVEAKPALLPAARRSAAVAVEPTFKVVNVRSDDVLNVREGPSSEEEVVGSIASGGRGIAMTGACRSQWCPVRHLDVRGWVNRTYLEGEGGDVAQLGAGAAASPQDSPDAPRGCLTAAAQDLLARIEARFGPIQLVSTCRPGATIAGSARLSRHRDGNAIDFRAGARKQAVVDWLVANHARGGTMTYRDMDHIHVDIGPHFVALASAGRDWSSERMGLSARK